MRYFMNQRHGVEKYFFKTGQLQTQTQWRFGIKHGYSLLYNKKKEILKKTRFTMDKLVYEKLYNSNKSNNEYIEQFFLWNKNYFCDVYHNCLFLNCIRNSNEYITYTEKRFDTSQMYYYKEGTKDTNDYFMGQASVNNAQHNYFFIIGENIKSLTLNNTDISVMYYN
jgi:antitoxin component YwqK of YwqJK toxin-antitoxin module